MLMAMKKCNKTFKKLIISKGKKQVINQIDIA